MRRKNHANERLVAIMSFRRREKDVRQNVDWMLLRRKKDVFDVCCALGDKF